MKQTIKNKKAFTLVETILAISVIGIVITATASLTQSSLKIGNYAMNRFVAFHLAEEGLEVVHNIRDTNWLQNSSWRNGLGNGRYAIVDNNLSDGARWSLESVADFDDKSQVILNDHERFTRIIELSSQNKNGGETMRVVSIVKYDDSGTTKEISIAEDLTDWKKGPL